MKNHDYKEPIEISDLGNVYKAFRPVLVDLNRIEWIIGLLFFEFASNQYNVRNILNCLF